MNIEEIKRIINNGNENEKQTLQDVFKKYGNTYEKEEEVHELLISIILQLSEDEIIKLSKIIGYPVFLRICLMPKIRHKFPLLQDGAALILIDEDNNVLVQQRMDNGKYGFSGGCQELGEELTDVAIRECFEETGLLLDKDKIIDVCEVSGLSRKNKYPNGDVVVNNTALHIGYLSDCKGVLRKDSESKQVFFKSLSFLENLSDEEKHDKDFVGICRMYLNGEKPYVEQEQLQSIELPSRSNMSFTDYLNSLNENEALQLAKKIGYQTFLSNSLDERIKNIFPRLIDKSIVISIRGEEILIEKVDGRIRLPKRYQSVGESFEDLISTSFGISKDNLKLSLRMSGEKLRSKEYNGFINALIFETATAIAETETLKYKNISEVIGYLDEEDKIYYQEYLSKKEKNTSKKTI